MGEIAAIYSKLEKQPQIILISFVLCWPTTYSILYGLWGEFGLFGVFDRIVFSIAVELLVLAAYVLLLSGVVSMRKAERMSYDHIITIGRMFGPVVYAEAIAFCVGMLFKNTLQSGSGWFFIPALVVVGMLLVFIRIEFKRIDQDCTKQQQEPSVQIAEESRIEGGL